MAKLLYLVHRMPYPPNKGDKVRSYHLLRHLAASHEVHVGTFVDDPDDLAHLPALRQWCASLKAVRLHPRRARVASLAGLLTGRTLTEHYYRDAGLAKWVAQTVGAGGFDASVVFSSSMAPYAMAHPALPMLVDFVDVDSAKWTDYAPRHRFPMSSLYAMEGRRLLALEREVASKARWSFFATDKEAALFHRLAPESARRVEGMANGVDAEFFAPAAARVSPFLPTETPLVFTGAMDYWPNVDAVTWFAREMLPVLRLRHPKARLHIVGRSPTPAVKALAGEAVSVSGTVPDVRPYLQHAAVVVAPLRLARGIQNKVLEAMAMQRPVVAAADCVGALDAQAGVDILPAAEAADYVRVIDGLLGDPAQARAVGEAGRRRVLASYAWPVHMARFDRALEAVLAGGPAQAAAASWVAGAA
jgi:polysaccharide biosynthesis protein PslH